MQSTFTLSGDHFLVKAFCMLALYFPLFPYVKDVPSVRVYFQERLLSSEDIGRQQNQNVNSSSMKVQADSFSSAEKVRCCRRCHVCCHIQNSFSTP